MTKSPLPGVTTSSNSLPQEERDLPIVRISDGFDLDAYKLMEESGYDLSKPPFSGHAIDAKPYEPNDTKKMVQKQGDGVVTARIGLGYMPSQWVKNSRQHKDKWPLTQYNMAEEAGNDKGDNATSRSK